MIIGRLRISSSLLSFPPLADVSRHLGLLDGQLQKKLDSLRLQIAPATHGLSRQALLTTYKCQCQPGVVESVCVDGRGRGEGVEPTSKDGVTSFTVDGSYNTNRSPSV
jgi:hypothetical protein